MLLIGQDVPEAMICYETRQGFSGAPFGWTVNGPLNADSDCRVYSSFIGAEEKLDSQVARFWKLVSLHDDDTEGMFIEDQYINNDSKRFHTFVANRTAVIRGASEPDEWRHIPSACNAADDVSRGLNAQALAFQSRRWNGPEFLTKSEDNWPRNKFSHNLQDDDPEIKKDRSSAVSCATASHGHASDVVDRGKPAEFRSDNATNFKSGDRELKEAVQAWNHAQISSRLTQNNIEWKQSSRSLPYGRSVGASD